MHNSERERDLSDHKSDKVHSEYLFKSDFYEIKDWQYNLSQEKQATPGYNDCLCMVFVRNGAFLIDIARKNYDLCSGVVLFEKPDYEYRMRPASGICSIFNFTNELYSRLVDDCNLHATYFFNNPGLLSLAVKSTPATEYLHHQAIKRSANGAKLEMDYIVIELLKSVVGTITDEKIDDERYMPLAKYQLAIIERAKEYIHDNFSRDISLNDISEHSFSSPFHFSRMFKNMTSFSPYQYLLEVRLKHGEMLLRNSVLSINEIAIFAGFSSGEHFATSFKRKYGHSPSRFRKLDIR